MLFYINCEEIPSLNYHIVRRLKKYNGIVGSRRHIRININIKFYIHLNK